MIDEEFIFADCLERCALKRSANEEVYKKILSIGNEKSRVYASNAKNLDKGKYEPL